MTRYRVSLPRRLEIVEDVLFTRNPAGTINELVEVFNQMVKDLRYNLQELEKANTEKSENGAPVCTW